MPEEKLVEREYIIPLRKKFLNTPKYKRVPKAIKIIKEFTARHMKVPDRDTKKVKIDKWLNIEMWFKGIKNPPGKIKIKARKLENGDVSVQLVEVPEKLKWKIHKEARLKEEADKIKEKKKTEEEVKKAEEKKEEVKEEEEVEKEEKIEAVEEAGLKEAEKKARQLKHAVKVEKGPKHQFRKALKK